MKQIRLLSVLLCLVLLLSACNRTVGDPPSPNEESTESVPQPNELGVWYMRDLMKMEYAFPIEGLYGESYETLLQTDAPAIYSSNLHSLGWGILDTGTSLLLQLGRTGLPTQYDKSSGRFSSVCHDPLCTHQPGECIWGEPYRFVYRNEQSLLYALCPTKNMEAVYGYEGASFQLWVSDLQGDGLRMLYESDGREIDRPILCGKYVFFVEHDVDPETDKIYSRLLRIPLDGGRAEVIFPKLQEDTLFYLPLNQGEQVLYILYENLDREDENSTVYNSSKSYLYTVKTGEQTLFGEGFFPDANYRGWIYYSTEDGYYRAPETDLEHAERVFDESAGTYHYFFCGDRIYYLKQSVFSESETYGKYFRNDIYSAALDGTDETLFMQFQTDGIPDHVFEFCTDGKLLLTEYQTYLDSENEFQPVFVPESPYSNQNPYTCALIDLSTGERLLFSSAYMSREDQLAGKR